ncbi:phospholipid-transporting ATPase ABCA3-like [Amblyomma americanum]
MPHPFVVQVSLVVWKDLVVYRVRRKLLVSVLELSAPVFLMALFWCSSAAYPDLGRVQMDARASGARRDPCDAPYQGRRVAFAPAANLYARELLLRAFPRLAASRDLEGFANAAELLKKADTGALRADVAVLFDGIDEAAASGSPSAPGDLNYTLLFDEPLPPEKFVFRCPGPRAIDDDQEEMLLRTLWPVQCRLNRAHLALYAETRNIQPRPPEIKVRMKRFPLPSMEVDVGACQPLYPWAAMLLFEVGLLPLCLNYIYRFIEEKVNDKREWMLIQGLRNGAFLWGKGIACFVFATLPCLPAMALVTWPHRRVLFTALSYSSPTALFFVIFLPYAARLAASCVLFGTLFMSRWICAHAFTLWWLLGAVLALSLELEMGDLWNFVLCLAMPNFSLTLAVRAVWESERKGVGFSWTRLDPMGAGAAVIASPLSLVLLVPLVWYLDSVWPWPDRMRRKNFQFVLQDEFWQGSPEAGENRQPPDMHCCSSAGEPAVSLVDVKKRVGNVEMEHLSIDLIRNRVNVIFGHSGSGKSTLVKMICGIIQPDDGNIYVHDVSVRYALSEARSMISYCAEHSTLFDFMTVKEHIQLSQMLNASSLTPASRRWVDTAVLLKDMRLADYADARISTLAIGVQRKVALAVALSRPAEVLVLDEPTAGMDAISQADVWKLLWIMRRSSTIIMTSNKSAEVDVLADRAVVLARGVVQLNDTVDNLRRDLRLGHRLCLLRHLYASSEVIRARLTSWMPEHRVLSEIGLEIMLYLPGVTVARARELAQQLRREKRDLGLVHVGEPYRTIEDGVMRIWNRIHEPRYAGIPSDDYSPEGASPDMRHKKVTLLAAYWQPLACAALASGLLFYALHASLADRDGPADAYDSGRRVALDAAGVGLAAFVADWRPSPGFAGVVLRALLEDSGVEHRLPLDAEPETYLRSLDVREWRRHGWGVEIHAGVAGPGDCRGPLSGAMRQWKLLRRRSDTFRLSVANSATYSLAGGSGHWATLWWSGERWASGGAALTTLHAAQLSNASRVRGARIRAQAGPLPGARWEAAPSAQRVLGRVFNDVPVVACVLSVSAVLAPTSGLFAAMASAEGRSGLQLLQLMTGLLSLDYWLSHFLWDFATLHVLGFCVPVAPPFLYFYADRGALFLSAALALFLAYGVAAVPAAHLLSRVFPNGCQVTIIFISLAFGVVPTMLELVWDAEGPDTAPTGRALTSAARAVPSAALSASLVRLLRLQALGELCEMPTEQRLALCRQMVPRLPTRRASLAVCCPEAEGLKDTPVPSWEDLLSDEASIAHDLTLLLACGLVCLLLSFLGDAVLVPLVHRLTNARWRPATAATSKALAAIEASGLMRSPLGARASGSQQPLVTGSAGRTASLGGSMRSPTLSPVPAPSQQMLSSPRSTHYLSRSGAALPRLQPPSNVVLEAAGLQRCFGPLVAVRDVSLSVREGECVGLLGQSGSGKSTTLRMLSGELLPTAGSSTIYGQDLRSRRAGYVNLVGFQPSDGGFVPQLTARQHLYLLATLRLLPAQNVRLLVEHLLRLVELDWEADKPAMHYCRSSQRKLGLAMALLGAPRLVLLDEPTSGVDPISARKMWQTLDAFSSANDQAVVLATTLIPECLALCSRVFVLSRGESTWVGSVPDLRNTFFMGMVVTVTMCSEEKPPVLAAFLNRVNEIFEGEAQVVSRHKNVIRFKIRDPLYPMRLLKPKLVELRNVGVVSVVDFGHVALHKLFGVEEPE